jgi:hypothetical protein
MGIKVENDMLVLDNTFSKEDVQAIDEFVKINVDRERKRITRLLFEYGTMNYISEQTYTELAESINFSGNKE